MIKTSVLIAIVICHTAVLAQQVPVTKFGARGNDTLDDTKAIQMGIDYLAKKGGGELYFPEGIYMISNQKVPGKSISVKLASNVRLIGDGIGKSILKLRENQPNFTRLLLAEDITNVSIKGLTFDGNTSSQTNPRRPNEHLHGIFIDRSADLLIDNSEFINTGGDGICIRGVRKSSTNIQITNCTFDGTKRNGVTLGSGFRNVKIANCYFGKKIERSPIDTEPTSGICGDVIIENNLIETNSLLTLGGVSPSNMGFNQVLRNNTLTNCSIYIIYGSGITIENNKITGSKKKAAITILRKNENITIAGNTIRSNNQSILNITYSAKQFPNDIKILNNQIHYAGSLKPCFNIKGADNIQVRNNTVNTVANAGIFMDIAATRSMKGFTFSGNNVGYFKQNIRLSFVKQSLMNAFEFKGNKFANKNLDAISKKTTGLTNLSKDFN